MKLSLAFLFLLFGFSVHAEVENKCESGMDSVVARLICMDDQVTDIEELRVRVQNNVYTRIETKYGKKDAARAKFLKSRFDVSVAAWDQYRFSYCEMESISVTQEDDQVGFVRQCLISLTKTRIEELRILQISI